MTRCGANNARRDEDRAAAPCREESQELRCRIAVRGEEGREGRVCEGGETEARDTDGEGGGALRRGG